MLYKKKLGGGGGEKKTQQKCGVLSDEGGDELTGQTPVFYAPLEEKRNNLTHFICLHCFCSDSWLPTYHPRDLDVKSEYFRSAHCWLNCVTVEETASAETDHD